MWKVVFVAFCLLVFSSLSQSGGQAKAADLDWRTDRNYRGGGYKDEPVMVPRYRFSWTGFYLGGHLGYSWGDSATRGSVGAFDGGGDGFVIHPSGWVTGLQGGYSWQQGNLVYGIEGDLGFLSADDEQSSATAFFQTEYGGYGTLTGRLGYAEDRWLFYLKGGIALANIENRAGALVGGAIDPTDLTETDDTRLGWTIGTGAEFAFNPSWSLKIEYLYMDFGQDSSTNIDGDLFRHDNDLHTIKVGINYRFQPVDIPLR